MILCVGCSAATTTSALATPGIARIASQLVEVSGAVQRQRSNTKVVMLDKLSRNSGSTGPRH